MRNSKRNMSSIRNHSTFCIQKNFPSRILQQVSDAIFQLVEMKIPHENHVHSAPSIMMFQVSTSLSE